MGRRFRRDQTYTLLVALAAVSLGIGFLGAGCGSSRSSSGSISRSDTKTSAPTFSTNWAIRLRSRIHCGRGVRLRVLQVLGFAPREGERLKVVLAQCQLMDGTGDAGLFSYTVRGVHASFAQTLLQPRSWLFPRGTIQRTSSESLALPVYAYSANSVPRASPDIKVVLSWRWQGQRFLLVKKPPPHITP